MRISLSLLILLCFVLLPPSVLAAPSTKKIIEFGWDTPFPQALHDHVAEWQDRPFDGIIFSLEDNGGDVFNLKDYDPAKLGYDAKLLTGLHWGRFTDNFLQLKCESNMNWTSDSDWKTVLAHVALCAKAARAAGCKGFAFDPEPYGGADPWDYRSVPQDKLISFTQYSAIIRKRGGQFIQALQGKIPDVKLLMYYQYSELLHELGPLSNQSARDAALAGNGYGLMPAFIDGMLAASNPEVQFIDGNEPSYYYQDAAAFSNAYNVIHHDSSVFVAPDVLPKFYRQERAAQAVYSDYIFNLRPDAFKSNIAIRMNAAQRDQWFESNLYYGLKSSDEYVWLYSETLHWWPPEDPRPTGMEDAIRSVKTKVDNSQPLGFDISSLITTANIKKIISRL
jgi:hypothetical protein